MYQQLFLSTLVSSFLIVQFIPQYSIGGSYTTTAAVVLVLQWLSCVIYAVILYPRYFSPLRHLPMPKGNSFFMGHFKAIADLPSGVPQLHWQADLPNKGLIRYLHIFNFERVLLTSPKALAEVLTTQSYNFGKPPSFRRMLQRIIGHGLVLAEGSEHKFQRRNLGPAFHYRNVKNLYPRFWSKSKELVQRLKTQINGESSSNIVEIGNWASRATLDMIGVAGMGRDFGALENPNTDLSLAYKKVFEPDRMGQLLGMMGMFLPPRLLEQLPVQRNRDVHQAMKVIRGVSKDLIRQKKESLDKGGEKDNDIISVALSSGAFTDDNLIDQMMTMLAAGHETTSAAFTWAVYELCKKPDVQNRLRAELHAEMKSLDGAMDSTKLDKMQYLQAICNETLRHNPPLPVLWRRAEEACTIADTYIPKGVIIILSPGSINLSPEFWGPDAADFNPDRWLGPGRANTGGVKDHHGLMTFLHGPRSCIGISFAKAEFASMVAAFVASFEFELAEPEAKVEAKGGIVARPFGGLNIKLKVVEGW